MQKNNNDLQIEEFGEFELGKKDRKRIVSFILSALLILGMIASAFPLTAIAEEISQALKEIEPVNASATGNARVKY